MKDIARTVLAAFVAAMVLLVFSVVVYNIAANLIRATGGGHPQTVERIAVWTMLALAVPATYGCAWAAGAMAPEGFKGLAAGLTLVWYLAVGGLLVNDPARYGEGRVAVGLFGTLTKVLAVSFAVSRRTPDRRQEPD